VPSALDDPYSQITAIIKSIPISELNPAAYNPRKDLQEGDPEYERLKRSIQEFGYVDPIIWNKQTGNVVGGHQRLKILLQQGYTEVEASVVDLDEAREKALNLALNKISGCWDDDLLEEVLAGLDEADLSVTGFSDTELETLLTAFDSSYLEDLYNETFVGNGINAERDTFEITFSIEREYRREFHEFVKSNGKTVLVDAMLLRIREGAA